MAALEWVLFGRVMDTIDDGDDHILRRVRPIIDQKFYSGKEIIRLTIIVRYSISRGHYSASVEIKFTQQISICPRKESSSISDYPLSDSDLEVILSLRIDEKLIETSCPAEELHREQNTAYIEEITLHDVSRFFFVKGDAIREFTGLIFE